MSKGKSILVFIEDGSYTFDNRMQREISALLDRGCDISVICRGFKGDPFYQKINDCLRVYYFPNISAASFLGHVFEHIVSLFFGFFLTAWISHACVACDERVA